MRPVTWERTEALHHEPWPAVNPPLVREGSELPTDKFTMGYVQAYEELAAAIGPAGRVLEVGVAFGDSLQLWQRLFPQGLVAGADWDRDAKCPEGAHLIHCAQDSPMLPQLAADISPVWDLIVDDASHDGALTEATHRLLWPLVAPGGWYVIEDWQLGFTAPWKDLGRFGGDAMLRLATSFIRALEPAAGSLDFAGAPNVPSGSGIAEARYRFGQAMLRKAA